MTKHPISRSADLAEVRKAKLTQELLASDSLCSLRPPAPPVHGEFVSSRAGVSAA